MTRSCQNNNYLGNFIGLSAINISVRIMQNISSVIPIKINTWDVKNIIMHAGTLVQVQ